MMWQIVLLALLFSSCAERHFSAHQFLYHDTGEIKPKVAIVPIITHSANATSWNLSEELTSLMSERLLKNNHFFLTSDFSVLGNHLTDLTEINPLIEDIRWLYENGSSSEFVVFVELVEHTLIPKLSKLPPQSYTLHMAFRTHVIDIRGTEPKVILQELIRQSFPIAIKIDYGKTSLNKWAFFFFSMGSAHYQMVKKITQQIQDYILLAKGL